MFYLGARRKAKTVGKIFNNFQQAQLNVKMIRATIRNAFGKT